MVLARFPRCEVVVVLGILGESKWLNSGFPTAWLVSQVKEFLGWEQYNKESGRAGASHELSWYIQSCHRNSSECL